MADDKKKVKFDIDNGREFFADEVGVIHNPLKTNSSKIGKVGLSPFDYAQGRQGRRDRRGKH